MVRVKQTGFSTANELYFFLKNEPRDKPYRQPQQKMTTGSGSKRARNGAFVDCYVEPEGDEIVINRRRF